MAKIRTLVIGGAVGAALTYFLDAELGPARRAQLKELIAAGIDRGRHELNRQTRQLQDRSSGTIAELQAGGAPRPEDDLTVLSRVESILHAMPDFPRSSVEAEVVQGRLILRGGVESAELAREIVETAGHVRGVDSVENLLQISGEAQA